MPGADSSISVARSPKWSCRSRDAANYVVVNRLLMTNSVLTRWHMGVAKGADSTTLPGSYCLLKKIFAKAPGLPLRACHAVVCKSAMVSIH